MSPTTCPPVPSLSTCRYVAFADAMGNPDHGEMEVDLEVVDGRVAGSVDLDLQEVRSRLEAAARVQTAVASAGPLPAGLEVAVTWRVDLGHGVLGLLADDEVRSWLEFACGLATWDQPAGAPWDG